MRWLAEQDLITIDPARPDFLIVTATARGVEVAQGNARPARST